MIRNTFSMLDGAGERLERSLWRRGILEWKDFIGAPAITSIGVSRKAAFDRKLMDAAERLDRGDSAWFASALPRREHWRLYEEFRHRAVCLDIETNGWHPAAGGQVTVVGLYDGFDYKAFVRGENLSAPALERELSGYRYLITFFGSSFDMPFLRQTLGVGFDGAHFDLCYGARRIGMKGGLKKIEPLMGIARDESVRGMDGYEAVRLWHEVLRGSAEARGLLIAYNREDTVNLMALAGMIYPMLRARTGIEEYLH